jgi:hypothetical protein
MDISLIIHSLSIVHYYSIVDPTIKKQLVESSWAKINGDQNASQAGCLETVIMQIEHYDVICFLVSDHIIIHSK